MRASCPPPRMPTVVIACATCADRRCRRRRRSACARNAASAAPIAGWSLASIAAANSAALAAPALPMAKVATGIPAGICTIDSSESMPLSALLCTGTPSTGTAVLAASMPGRCAAPPAPAMIARRPRACAAGRVLEQHVRGAVRGDHAHFVRHAERFQFRRCVLHGLPVGAGAHHDPHQWCVPCSGHVGSRRQNARSKPVF